MFRYVTEITVNLIKKHFLNVYKKMIDSTSALFNFLSFLADEKNKI